MKAQFISTLLTQTWQIDPARARTIIGSLVSRLRSERPEEDVFGDPLPKMQIVGDVAVIPIVGVLALNVPDWIKSYGFSLTDVNDIEQEVDRALNDPNVAIIAQNIDSPGGSSYAGNKLFDIMEAAGRKKPLMSWCGDGATVCSAAYNGAAPSVAIYSGKYACVGSIGAYMTMLDETEYWKMLGITWEVFRSGELKGIGEDGLSDEQRAFLQQMVDETGARFRRNVSKYRSLIAAEDMRGQWYQGDEALRRGFVAGNAKDIGTALTRFRKLL